jgi:ketosteroid isomerase-like protein
MTMHIDDPKYGRDAAVELAWRPWHLISQGRVADGLAVLDDAGTWWEMASRAEQPMMHIKAVLAEVLDVVPMTFELIGSVVEGRRVALMVESHGQVDQNTMYHNAYTFVTDLDPNRDAIIAVREYVDTLHAANVLIPAVTRAIHERGGKSALATLLESPG